MNSCFDDMALFGLSQGGAAVLLVGLQSEPKFAAVASGHSILFQHALPAGADQIVGVPGYFDGFHEEILFSRIRESPTHWLFTWGKREIGIYGLEARGGPTYEALKGLENVTVFGHESGHVFPGAWPENFFQSSLHDNQTVDRGEDLALKEAVERESAAQRNRPE